MNSSKDFYGSDSHANYSDLSNQWANRYPAGQMSSTPGAMNTRPAPQYQRVPEETKHTSELQSIYATQGLEQIYNMSSTSTATPAPVSVPAKIPPMFAASSQASKFQKKVFFPPNTGINYIGLLIGPKGMYQKKLEEQTGCKILIRGKYLERANNRGTQRNQQQAQNESEEEQHVLVTHTITQQIIGETEHDVENAEDVVAKIINADEGTRAKIRAQQLQEAQEMNSTIYGTVLH